MKTTITRLLAMALLLVALQAQVCPSNTYTDPNRLCKPCAANCATCTDGSYCLTCTANNFLVALPTSVECKPCSVVLNGCLICLTNVACETCQNGFILSNSSCLTCDTRIPNCSNCSKDGSTCNQCRYPYILFENKCISSTIQKIVQGVPTVYQNTTAGLAPRVVLDYGARVPAVLDLNGCNQYQVWWNNKCIRQIFQCLVYENGGLCKICGQGWIRTIFGDCEVEKYVLRCENGYWLDSKLDKCVKVDVSCDWFFPNNGTCYNCSTNYMMNTNRQCVPRVNCSSRQFYFEGKCISVPLACLTFLPNGTCTSCTAGNNIVSGVCTPSVQIIRAWNDCVFPCATCFYAQLNYCFSCAFGYALKDNRYGTCLAILQ